MVFHFCTTPSWLLRHFRVGKILYIQHWRPQMCKSSQVVEFLQKVEEKLYSLPSEYHSLEFYRFKSWYRVLIFHILKKKKHNTERQVLVHCVCSSEYKAIQNLHHRLVYKRLTEMPKVTVSIGFLYSAIRLLYVILRKTLLAWTNINT